MKHFFTILCLLLGFCASAWSMPAATLSLQDADNQALTLTPYLEVLEDPSTALRISDVLDSQYASQFQAQDNQAEALSFGFTRSAYWFRLRLDNPTEQPQTRLLQVANYALSYVDFYAPVQTAIDSVDDYQAIHTGAALPFSSRAVKNRFYVFPITVPAQSQQIVYLRIQALDGMVVPARLWTERGFQEHSKQDYIAQSLYYGMVIALVLFNLLMFVALRDRTFLLYVTLEAIFAISLASFGGLAHEFFWPETSNWSNIAHFVGWSCMGIPLILFIQSMMHKSIVRTWWNKVFNLFIVAHLMAIAGMLANKEPFFVFSITLHSIGSLLFFGSVFTGMKRKDRSAYFLFISFAFVFMGVLLTIARGIGLLPTNFLTVNGLQIGSALEMITLAFALADRFNQIRKEKAADQAALLQKHNEAQLAQAEKQAQQAQNASLMAQAELARKDAALAQKDAEYAQKEAEHAQNQLQQADKMASLGQLVASVTHEINTPIGAISSSGQSMSEALTDVVSQLPPLLKQLDDTTSTLLIDLLLLANQPKLPLSSREERALIKKVTEQLDAAGLEQARQKAGFLVSFHAHQELDKYLPLLQHPQSEAIEQAARSVASAMGNARNVNVAVERVAKIVKALKSFSHFNVGTEKIDANLVDGMETVLTIYQGQTKVGVDVVRNYEDIPLLHCFPDELNQVWTNLIHNALQAMNHEGTLTIGIREENGHAVVSVGDSGCGIPQEIRGKIFDVFFTTKPAGVGSGLGLDIVKKIIDKHHGRIELQSEVGVGTTFTVLLPYLQA
jgi:signal transduction histidine kinase